MPGYCVYKHTSPDGKVYIGITKYNPTRRWGKYGTGYKSNTHFWRAICKYGWDAFSHEIVASLLTKEDAAGMEKELIAQYRSNDPEYGYNITAGGEVNILPKSSLDKISEKNRNAVFTPEHRRKISEARKRLLAEHPEKAATRTGYKMTPEHSRLLCDAARRATIKRVECMETGTVYSSLTEASNAIGVSKACISEAIRGKQKTAAGFTWRFAEVVK